MLKANLYNIYSTVRADYPRSYIRSIRLKGRTTTVSPTEYNLQKYSGKVEEITLDIFEGEALLKVSLKSNQSFSFNSNWGDALVDNVRELLGKFNYGR